MVRPKKPPTTTFAFRLDKALYDRLVRVAMENDRKVAAQLSVIIREWLESNDRAAK